MGLDERAEQLAELVVAHSVGIVPEDVLLIRSDRFFQEFVDLVAKRAMQRGATIITEYHSPEELRSFIERCDPAEFTAESDRLCRLAEQATASIRVDSESYPFYLKGVDPSKIATYERIVESPVRDRITGDGDKFPGIKWNLLAFPCPGEARKAGMRLDEFSDMAFNAMLQDWGRIGIGMRRYMEIFNDAREVRVHVPGLTDLSFSLRNRGGDVCDGKYNLPDGEFFFGPVEDSTEGYVYFPYPATRDSNTVLGVYLRFQNGRITKFAAKQNHQYLEQMLALNGARILGEFGVGLNRGIIQYIDNLLFDEKIMGTVHFALGDSYKPSANPLWKGGGLNKSELHWDLVCELRPINGNPGGTIYVNGKPMQRNGVWLV
ncbi:aminopeptidase [Candidatus Woesearchaeota archaeon]|nr:aminopeptidase [Candidatus Woesearchaeota archaeon]